MSIYLVLLLLILLASPLAQLVTGLVNTYEQVVARIRQASAHIYFPEPGRDLNASARLDGDNLVIGFSVRGACSIHVYATPSSWFSRIPGTNEAGVLMQGFFVIAERDLGEKQCKYVSKTVTLPLPRDMAEKSARVVVLVNGKRVLSLETGRNPGSIASSNQESVTVIGGSYAFFDNDARIRIEGATVYEGRLYLCISVTHDGSGDYIGLVSNPPDTYRVYYGKPSSGIFLQDRPCNCG